MYSLRFTSIKNNPKLEGQARWTRDVVYSEGSGTKLTMQLLQPWASLEEENKDDRWPCIVFVQGSAWTFPDVGYQFPQLADFARKGYVIATVTHRSSVDYVKAPAFLEDVKAAIRFLRKNADQFRIDTQRIGIWGTSSGGNTALLVGLTGDDPLYRNDEYKEYSDQVKTVIDCFGPADMMTLFQQGIPETEADESPSIFVRLLGETKEEQVERLHVMNPMEKIREAQSYPPFLLIHGDQDELVPYEQSEVMAQKLCEHDVHTELIRVEGAPHEGNFWSRELLALIEDFLLRTL